MADKANYNDEFTSLIEFNGDEDRLEFNGRVQGDGYYHCIVTVVDGKLHYVINGHDTDDTDDEDETDDEADDVTTDKTDDEHID